MYSIIIVPVLITEHYLTSRFGKSSFSFEPMIARAKFMCNKCPGKMEAHY